jgi:hypothetical protein
MEITMARTLWLSIGIAAVSSMCFASTQVNVSPLLQEAKRIAILPAQCPPSVDCIWVEQVTLERLLLLRRFFFEESHLFDQAKDATYMHSRFQRQPGYMPPKDARVTIIPSDKVRQTMFETQVRYENPADRSKLAEVLKADAFLAVRVGEASSEQQGTTAIVTTTPAVGGVVTSFGGAVPVFTNRGNVEIVVVSAEGKPLVDGIGYGESVWSSRNGVLASIISDILKEAFSRK